MSSAFFPAQECSTAHTSSREAGPWVSAAHGSLPDGDTGRGGDAPGKHVSAYAPGTRGLRFPSSRRYLWDRTPAGPQVLVDAQDLVPRMSVSASALSCIASALAAACAGGAAGCTVVLRLGLDARSASGLTALLQPADAGAAAGVCTGGEVVTVPCALLGGDGADGRGSGGGASDRQAIEAAGGGDDALAARLAAGLDMWGETRVSQLFALCLCAAPASPGRTAPALLGRLALPGEGLLVTPLNSKRMCATPLAEALLRPGRVAPGASGYLSMDQARSLLPMDASDDNAHSTPLVGVWVKGPGAPSHPLVAAACLRFYYASTLLDRALQQDGAFLLLLCPEGQTAGRCYEVQPTEPGGLPVASYSLAADLDPTAQLDRHPNGLVPLGWVADARCPPPLPAQAQAQERAQAQAPRLGAPREQREGGAPRPVSSHGPGGSEAEPQGRQPGSGPPAAPRRGDGAAGPGRRGGGVVASLHARPQVQTVAAAGLGPGATNRYARPASSSSAGGSPARACEDDLEPRPRPSPWGLRPYGSPRPSSGGALQQQQRFCWSDALDAGCDGALDDLCRATTHSSPVRVEHAAPSDGASTPRAQRSPTHAGAAAAGAFAASVAPGSPLLPVLLGSPNAPSPRHVMLPGGAFAREVLRDSLDSGRRALGAAAAAIANAEAAVLRGCGCGGAGDGLGGTATAGSRDWAETAAAGGAPPPSGADRLDWSLRRSAQAAGGVAAALDAAAGALQAPGATGPRSASAWSPHHAPYQGAAGGGNGRFSDASGAAPAAWTEEGYGAAPPPTCAAAAGAGRPPTSVVAFASWAPQPDPSARELVEEVARLRTELARMQQLLADATRLPKSLLRLPDDAAASPATPVAGAPACLACAPAQQPLWPQPAHEGGQAARQQPQAWAPQGPLQPSPESAPPRHAAPLQVPLPPGAECEATAAAAAPGAAPHDHRLPGTCVQAHQEQLLLQQRQQQQPQNQQQQQQQPASRADASPCKDAGATASKRSRLMRTSSGAAEPETPAGPKAPHAAGAAGAERLPEGSTSAGQAAPPAASSPAASPAQCSRRASPQHPSMAPASSTRCKQGTGAGPCAATEAATCHPSEQRAALVTAFPAAEAPAAAVSGDSHPWLQGASAAAARATASPVTSPAAPPCAAGGAGRQPRRRRGLAQLASSVSSGGSSSAGDCCDSADDGGPPRPLPVAEAVAKTAALFAVNIVPAAAGTPSASPRVASATGGARNGTGNASSAVAAASPLRSSRATLCSSSCALAPAGDVVRTRYTPLSSDEDEEDEAEMEARLMRKYGLTR